MATSPPRRPFDLPASLTGMDTGTLRLGAFEAQYEQLFSETLSEGPISAEDRERLNLAAAALGLDQERVTRLEAALHAASVGRPTRAPRDTIVDLEDPSNFTTGGQVSVAVAGRSREVSITFEPQDDEAITRRLKKEEEQNPRHLEVLHARFKACEVTGDVDGQWRTAAVLTRRGAASLEEAELYEEYYVGTPPRPRHPLTLSAWSLLFHRGADRLTGEIFAVIAPAALLGRVAAMRADRSLPRLDPKERHDPAHSTVSAVRAIAWSSATLGLQVPPIFVAPDQDTGLEIVPNIPPASRIGSRMLSNQSATQLAFHSGRHLTWFREEHFVCTLVPTLLDLGDLFIAALTLGAPELDLQDDVRERAGLIAEAISPVLELAQLRRLRELATAFMARGGSTDLHGWARAVGLTAGRAGLLLCGDLPVACDIAGQEPNGPQRVRDLERYFASDEIGLLRRDLGIAWT